VEGETLPSAFTTIASPGYFEALEIPLLRGRVFTEADRASAEWSIVINEETARRWFAGEDPLGQRIRLGGAEGRAMEIVGVVGATRNRGLDQPPQAEMFASSLQAAGDYGNQMFLVVRTRGEPRQVLPQVRAAVLSIDAQQPVYAVSTIEESFAAGQATRRVSLVALGIFAVFALLLAATGVYGVVAQAASQRTREIGVRMALGAQRIQVRRLVVRQAMVPVLIGAATGVAAAFGLGRLLAGLLFGVGRGNPVALGGAAAVMLGAALLAAWVPARRASRLDPVRALRMD
jgi:putative ABC transport system permease protein